MNHFGQKCSGQNIGGKWICWRLSSLHHGFHSTSINLSGGASRDRNWTRISWCFSRPRCFSLVWHLPWISAWTISVYHWWRSRHLAGKVRGCNLGAMIDCEFDHPKGCWNFDVCSLRACFDGFVKRVAYSPHSNKAWTQWQTCPPCRGLIWSSDHVCHCRQFGA